MRISAEEFERLRFDEGELDALRAGRLTETAREKLRLRLTHRAFVMAALGLGCAGTVLLLIVAGSWLLFGEAFGRLWAVGGGVRVFLSLGLLVLAALGLWIGREVRRFSLATREDLAGGAVSVVEGVFEVTRTPQGSPTYWIDGTRLVLIVDVVATPLINSLRPGEEYRAWVLPHTQVLCHAEPLDDPPPGKAG